MFGEDFKMKKIFALLLVLSLLCLSSCDRFHQNVKAQENNDCVMIKLDNFKGKKKINISHNSSNESGLYYSTNLTHGNVTVSCDCGLFWDVDQLFQADAENNLTDGGYYIDSNIKKITIIIVADKKTSGEILSGFTPFEYHKD